MAHQAVFQKWFDAHPERGFLRLAPEELEGEAVKTVYLVDIGYGGSYKFMQAIERWFKRNMPSVTAVRKRKAGSAFRDDSQELWDEIKSKGHAAVIGVGG